MVKRAVFQAAKIRLFGEIIKFFFNAGVFLLVCEKKCVTLQTQI